MINRRFATLALAAVSLLASASLARAATVTISFDPLNSVTANENQANPAGVYGNTRQYTVSGVTLTASAWNMTSASDTARTVGTNGAWLGTYDTHGLGVTNRAEGTGASPTHGVDNQPGSSFDYVEMAFNQSVKVTSVTVWAFSSTAPATVNWATGAFTSQSEATRLANSVTGTGTQGTTAFSVLTFSNTGFSSFFDIFANLSGSTSEYFKITSMTVETLEITQQGVVPLPQSAAMGLGLLAAIGGVGVWRRRRRSAELA